MYQGLFRLKYKKLAMKIHSYFFSNRQLQEVRQALLLYVKRVVMLEILLKHRL